jgi:hypothetical protein
MATGAGSKCVTNDERRSIGPRRRAGAIGVPGRSGGDAATGQAQSV